MIGCPPQELPAADPSKAPNCIGPAAPQSLCPLVMPGPGQRPWSLSTLPIPARIAQGIVHFSDVAADWYRARYSVGMSSRAKSVGSPPNPPTAEGGDAENREQLVSAKANSTAVLPAARVLSTTPSSRGRDEGAGV